MEKEQLILNSAQEYNILPLTSDCDVRCLFCSHRQNPPEVRTVSIRPRTLAEAERTMEFLDGSRPVFIGESATRIIEGEPFTHPQIKEILLSLRRRFPGTPVTVTTNGNRLDEEMAVLLKKLAPLEINLSLNSVSAQGRLRLMGKNTSGPQAAGFLRDHHIPFHGSLVAMPQIVGWRDIEETVLFLTKYGAKTVRVFLPGFTRLAGPELVFDVAVLHRELADFIQSLTDRCSLPVLLEPPLIRDLDPLIAGVIRGSRAAAAGLCRGDQVLSVNGIRPRSRVEAWQLLQKTGRVTTRVLRGKNEMSFVWDNSSGQKSGVVMEYDFDMERLADIEDAAAKEKNSRILILCSTLAAPLFERLPLSGRPERVGILPVPSIFFGGSIGAAGLLTVADFVPALEEWSRLHPRPEVVLLPQEAFDYRGVDLAGVGFWELEEKTGVRVKVI